MEEKFYYGVFLRWNNNFPPEKAAKMICSQLNESALLFNNFSFVFMERHFGKFQFIRGGCFF